MKFFPRDRFFLDKKIIITLYNLFFSSNIDSSQSENLRTERVTIRRYNNTIRIGLALDETMPFKSQSIDEFISIKY